MPHANSVLQAVSWVQWFCYSVAYRAGEPKPQPGTLKFVRHYRQIFIGIVIAYILFTIYQADWELQREGNLYKLLGTPVDVEESGLRSRFRVLLVRGPSQTLWGMLIEFQDTSVSS